MIVNDSQNCELFQIHLTKRYSGKTDWGKGKFVNVAALMWKIHLRYMGMSSKVKEIFGKVGWMCKCSSFESGKNCGDLGKRLAH